MNDLNKNQLILLTLLVSFVTSIGTGIITTALLQEAPAGVTQVINRVVERTIEQVAPVSTGVTTKDKQVVVVKEEDQVITAISRNTKSIVRIKDTALVDGVSVFHGLGMIVSKDGIVVSASRNGLNLATTYSAQLGDGTLYSMKYIGEEKGIAVFRIVLESQKSSSFEPISFTTSIPQLGQTAITVDGIEKNTVSIGRIIGITDMVDEGKDAGIIETDITVKPKTVGGPLTNLSGEIIGIRTMFSETNQTFIAASVIQKTIANILKK